MRLNLLPSLFLFLLFLPCTGHAGQNSAVADGSWFLDAAGVPEGLEPPQAERPLVVAIVDDGVRSSHRELAGFLWRNPAEIPANGIDDDGNGFVDDLHGWDAADHDNDAAPPADRLEEFYHGTHLAGIIARILGRAYGPEASRFVRIMPVKGLADQADILYIKSGYEGIRYAARNGADIILCAWGVGHISPDEEKILQEAEAAGAFLVSAAGNFPENRDQFPAAHRAVLAVAAHGPDGGKIDKSNYGPFVDLLAPGSEIEAADSLSDNGRSLREGTSMAAAIVAAAAAVVKLQYPEASAEQIRAMLKNGADPIEPADPLLTAGLGAGRLNLGKALDAGLGENGQRAGRSFANQQGYLVVASNSGPVSWRIAPPGDFQGIRFRAADKLRWLGRGSFSFFAEEGKDSPVAVSSMADWKEDVYVPATSAWVTFTPEEGGGQAKALLEYRVEPIPYRTLHCRGTVALNREGPLEDGSGPQEYSPNSDCKWLITAPEGQVVHFTFSEFDTETNTDLLYFFNGKGTHEKIMAVFSGKTLPPEFTSWSNQVLVWFVTNGNRQGQGWKGEYRFRDR